MLYNKVIQTLGLGIGVFISLFSLAGQGAAQAGARVPQIQVLLEEIDFGEVRAGTQVTQEFIVRNLGNGLLKILQVRPG